MLGKIVGRFAAIILLIILLPILLVITVILVFETKGHPFFKQRRIGKDEKVFTCYKFRTMSLGTIETGTHLVNSNSITLMGKYLRKTKLDELPQLINIIIGDMCFVGPRPNMVSQYELIEEREKRGIYNLLPGVTGVAQILGVDMSTPEKLARVDFIYKKKKCFSLDCYILYATLIGHGQGDRVTESSALSTTEWDKIKE